MLPLRREPVYAWENEVLGHNNIPKNRRLNHCYLLEKPSTAASPAAAAKSRAQRKKKEGGANPESHSTGGRGGARGRKRRAVQIQNPIAVRMELILLKCSGMVNFHNYFHDVLTVYACLTILGYVIMLLSHLSPCDYGFVPPLGLLGCPRASTYRSTALWHPRRPSGRPKSIIPRAEVG